MDIIVLDFESFYATGFSLSKITTEEYIRDPKFEVIGVAVKVNEEETVWFSGTKEETKSWLRQFPWENAVAVAHNAPFDMAILNWHFDIRPKRIADTLSMARPLVGAVTSVSLASLARHYGLGEKGTEVVKALGKRRMDFTTEELAAYGRYCCNDTELTYGLFLYLADGFPLEELKLIDLTVRMFTEPVLDLDEFPLKTHLFLTQQQKTAILGSIDKDDVMSNPRFAALLMGHGVVPPTKISATTGKETLAFAKSDEEFLALLEHPDVRVQALVAARLGVKSTLEETRTERFIGIEQRGKFPVPLRYYAAHTGRWGGDDKVNLQNLPRTSPLKKAIRAPQGYMLVDSDSSQIEARTLAWLAEQDDLVDAFERGEDVYRDMASRIYNVALADVSKEQRFVGKTTILGAGYGVGWKKLQATLKTSATPVVVSDEEAATIITTYRETYPQIPKLWKAAQKSLGAIVDNKSAPFGRDGVLFVEGEKGIRLPNGLYLRYPNMRRTDEGFAYDGKKGKNTFPKNIYGGAAVENVCQALARIIIGEQMLSISRKYKVAMTVHDSVVAVVPEGEVLIAQENIELFMRMRPSWALELPLNCEAHHGKTYGG